MLTKSLQNLFKMVQLGVQLGAQEVPIFSGVRLLGPNMFRFRVFVVFGALLGPSWGRLEDILGLF